MLTPADTASNCEAFRRGLPKSGQLGIDYASDGIMVTEDIKLEIVRRLVEGLNPEKIILFGSQAWGNPGPDSDIDLMVIVPNSNLRPAKRASLAYSFLHGLGVPKDVLVKTRAEFDRFKDVPASLEYKINQKGIVLYG